MVCQPQFLLFCDARASENHAASAPDPSSGVFGRWHFVLERLDGNEQLEAADSESSIHPDRLALLSVVRGLEALEQPSRVNLVTTSRYVSRGLKYGLSNWRESGYQWERFGIQKPVRNADLWQRVDQALQYHAVTCRLIQPDTAPAATPSTLPPTGAQLQPVAARQVQDLQQKIPESVREASTAVDSRSAHEDALGRPSGHSGAGVGCYSRLAVSRDWWEIAAAWVKWWRGRSHRPAHRPALYGT